MKILSFHLSYAVLSYMKSIICHALFKFLICWLKNIFAWFPSHSRWFFWLLAKDKLYYDIEKKNISLQISCKKDIFIVCYVYLYNQCIEPLLFILLLDRPSMKSGSGSRKYRTFIPIFFVCHKQQMCLWLSNSSTNILKSLPEYLI